MSKSKTKRILLGILLAGSITNVAHADEQTVYTFDDYTGKISATTNGGSYTYTDADGKEQTVNYDTVDSVEPGKGSVTVNTEVGTGSEATSTQQITIGGTDYTFTIKYDLGETQTAVTNDAGGTIDSITGNFSNMGETASGGTEHASAIYNSGTDSKITSISAVFINDGDATGGAQYEYGGAIYNGNGAYIGSISGSYFISNVLTNSGESGSEEDGAAIYNGTNSTIGSITGSYFVGNHINITNTSSTERDTEEGGVIHNEGRIGESGETTSGIIDSVFVGNSINITNNGGSETDVMSGGVVYNEGTISTILGSSFIGNSIVIEDLGSGTTNRNSINGGVIYNAGEITNGISKSDFIGNTGASNGGAIYNTSTINGITGSNFVENKASSSGGAIYNTGSIGDIKESNFLANTSSTNGGAIENDRGTMGDIESSYFEGNTSNSWGGAVYNSNGTIGKITGSYFVGNTALGDGAIGNIGSSSQINSIENSYFIENTANGDTSSNSNSGYAGAIRNSGTIETMSGNYFVENTATNNGGALDNYGTITTMSGNYFVTNKTSNNGGAIGNGGTISSIADYFEGNTAANNGGAISNHGMSDSIDAGFSTAEIKEITGSYFIGNTATNYYGGAIYNTGFIDIDDGVYYGKSDSSIGTITESYFIENTAALGGAIYNADSSATLEGTDYSTAATVTSIANSYFLGNTASGSGGAIYNTGAISGISGSTFADNTASGSGGAIYNDGAAGTGAIGDITADFSGNSATSESGPASGGAIYNNGTIGAVSGAFAGNSVSGGNAAGGAIYNAESAAIKSITATSLSGNTATGSGSAEGGAIYNENSNTAITVTGDIADNYVTAGTMAAGGAILSLGDVTVQGGSITGNYAEGVSAYGGAIINSEAKLTVDAVEISSNHATATTGNAAGGAIYNGGTMTVTAASITNNYAKSESGNAQGGAIYNEDAAGSITVTGDITGNYASGSGTAQGGAIYTMGNVTVTAAGTDIAISGNYTEGSDGKDDNAIYMAGADKTLTFSIANSGSVTLSDNIRGEDGYSVEISGDSADTSTFYLLNDVYDAGLTAGGVTINTVNNEIHQYAVKSFGLTGDVNFVADVDLANETMDTITAASYGSHAGNLNVSGMNLISDTENDSAEIAFAEDGLKDYVTSSVGTLPDSKNQQKAYTPLYEYNVAYDNRDDAGYFTFDKTGNNPSADVPEEAEAAAISFMNLMYRYAFEHSDYYMKLPRNVRQAIIKGENCGEDENCLENYRAYNGHNLTDPGIWVKPFASNETVPFGHQFTARTKNYGLLVGVDTAFKEKGRWANVFTGYVGYDGIRQTFSGNSTEQYGGLLGVTDTVYNGNFFAAVTLSGGDNVLKAKTMYGREKTHLYMGGAAVKTGYNMEFAGGNYSFLPTFMASYTYANIKDYTSASGLKMDSNGMHAVELNPNFKFIRNLNSGWMPYATVGEIWTVGQHSDVRASGTLLDELTFRPYTEYGLGVQKMWSKGYDGYAEFLGHAGGRRGFLVNLGFRWAF